MTTSYKTELVHLLDRKLNKRWPTIADNLMDTDHMVTAKEISFTTLPSPDELIGVIVHAMENFKARRMLRVPPSAGNMGSDHHIVHGRRCSLMFQSTYDHLSKTPRRSITFLLEVPKR